MTSVPQNDDRGSRSRLHRERNQGLLWIGARVDRVELIDLEYPTSSASRSCSPTHLAASRERFSRERAAFRSSLFVHRFSFFVQRFSERCSREADAVRRAVPFGVRGRQNDQARDFFGTSRT